MSTIQEKVDSLMTDLQQAVDVYNQASETLAQTKEKIISLQGALQALKELQEAQEVAE
jgi:hypothetical protein